jgi:putative ABC transport system permease protein
MKRMWESYFVTLGRRGPHRLRATLVVAHIAVSVALVIIVAGLAAGLSSTMQTGINSFVGSLVAAPKPPSQQGANAPRTLRNSDVEALEKNADPSLIKQVVPVVSGRALVSTGDGGDRDYGSIGIVGSNSGYLQLKLMTLASGRMFTDAEYENKARVTLIGPKLVSYFFNGDPQAAIGSDLTVGRQKFQVIGVTSGDGQDDDTVLMPLTSSRSFLYGNKDNVVAIGALATNLDSLGAATAQMQSILDRAHYVKEPDERDFTITSYTYLVPFMKSFLSLPRWFAAGATVALLFVGILGLANLMLITVSERHARIRHRRATGVGTGRIVGEVLVGSTVFAGLGAVIGIVLGVGSILALQLVMRSSPELSSLGQPEISAEAIAVAFLTSLLVGLLSGTVPAIRAARVPVGDGPGAGPEPVVPTQRRSVESSVSASSGRSV